MAPCPSARSIPISTTSSSTRTTSPPPRASCAYVECSASPDTSTRRTTTAASSTPPATPRSPPSARSPTTGTGTAPATSSRSLTRELWYTSGGSTSRSRSWASVWRSGRPRRRCGSRTASTKPSWLPYAASTANCAWRPPTPAIRSRPRNCAAPCPPASRAP